MAEPSKVINIDAPIGGWNAFDSLDNMPADCAIVLDNMIPQAGTVDTRGGTLIYADTGTGKPVETVASVDTQSNSFLLAASDGGVWRSSDSPPTYRAADTTEIAPVGTFNSSRWQCQNFRKADEIGILIMANGVDNVQILERGDAPYYDSLRDAIFDYGTYPAPLDPYIGVELFKGRAYYWSDNEDAFWYSQAGSYEGEMQKYNLGTFIKKGGKILFITTWTQQDSGDGQDDFIVFVMSTGEILVYQGDDPQTEGFFEMVGRYVTAEPLSIRGVDQYGADTVIMTTDGYITLSTIVQQGRVSDVPAFSRLISTAITDRTRYNSNFYGWECTLFPDQGLFIFNVPLLEDSTNYEQHVLNTITMKWCRFKDIPSNCMVVHKNRLFGGNSDGTVMALLEGTSDRGSAIDFMAIPAFQYLGNSGVHKFVSAAQVISTHSNPELIDLRGWSDFNWETTEPVQSPLVKESAVWSIEPAVPYQELGSFWDEDYWALQGNKFTTKGWQNVTAFGYSVTVMVRFRKVNEGVSWRSMGIRFNYAGAQ